MNYSFLHLRENACVGVLIRETGHLAKLYFDKNVQQYYAIFSNNSKKVVILKYDGMVSSYLGVRYPTRLQSGDLVKLSSDDAIYTVEM
jgi:hypothetical protein